jgi:RNA polymerase sigma factor (sigma-70 family)
MERKVIKTSAKPILPLIRRMMEDRGALDLSDRELLQRFRSENDQAAFDALLRRHGPMVLDLCRGILAREADAEDAFQATFLILARKSATIRKTASVGSWLHGVAHRTALKARAQSAARRKHESRGPVRPPREADDLSWREVRQVLHEEIDRLPARFRSPVVLCYLEGVTQEAAAVQLKVAKSTLRERLERGRALLRARLVRRGLGPTAALVAATWPAASASGTVSMRLVNSTIDTVSGAVSAPVAALTEGVLKTMSVNKLKIAIAAVGLAFAMTAGLTDWAFSGERATPAVGPKLIRSAQSGPWSSSDTWEGGNVPGEGARVQIRTGHAVTYDVPPKVGARVGSLIRSIHVAGTLTFARDRSTWLEVGLIKIQPGDDASENGFDCDAHVLEPKADEPRPALEVGTANDPIPAQYTATIQLRYFDGMDRESCPAIVCCGGRMDFHGAPLSRTWVKLGAPATAGATEVTLAEPVSGWRPGDRVILTSTAKQNLLKKASEDERTDRGSTRDNSETEERFIKAINGAKLTLDKPLAHDHVCDGDYRAEVANLSRNVVVQSAPAGPRGHTMYHRHSAGSIGYAEFRHLGKEGVLGRYSLHFHLAGDTMRGSSVIGASIWDSENRWLTIHGTNYVVVRDCVGYRSKGHGYFFEDGTEVYNVLDRNLAVQAYTAAPLPKQVIPFDQNDGAGFWWANSLNSFTRNVACECDEYGYFFQCAKTPDFDPVLPVLQADGTRKRVDIRTLPFFRFEDNESHCQRRHGFNLGGGVPFGPPNVDGVGPDAKHPFIVRNMRIWNVRWAIHPVSPSVYLDNVNIHEADYQVWRPEYNLHAYRGIKFPQKPIDGKGGVAPNDESKFPLPLMPVDDLPPVTVITHVRRDGNNLVVRGTASDNEMLMFIWVNDQLARGLQDAGPQDGSQWEVTLKNVPPGEVRLVAKSKDFSNNFEKVPHEMVVPAARR